jgi:hypothetical protein
MLLQDAFKLRDFNMAKQKKLSINEPVPEYVAKSGDKIIRQEGKI